MGFIIIVSSIILCHNVWINIFYISLNVILFWIDFFHALYLKYLWAFTFEIQLEIINLI